MHYPEEIYIQLPAPVDQWHLVWRAAVRRRYSGVGKQQVNGAQGLARGGGQRGRGFGVGHVRYLGVQALPGAELWRQCRACGRTRPGYS